MRHNMVKPISFVTGGLVVGAGVTYFVTKSKFKKIADEEISSMRQHFKLKEKELLLDKEDELEQIKQAHGLINHEDPREALKAYNERLDQLEYMRQQTEAAKTEQLASPLVGPKGDPGQPIPYHKIAKGKTIMENLDEQSLAPFEDVIRKMASGTDAEELRVVDEETDDDEVRRNIFEASVRQDVMNSEQDPISGPYVIPVEIFQEESDIYERITLSYYEDGTLADERNMPIPDANPIVGDENLEMFGEGSQDENIVYVRNEVLKTDFEVCREEGSYADSFMGNRDWSDDDKKTRPKRMREDG